MQKYRHLKPILLIFLHIIIASLVVIFSKEAFVSFGIHPLFFLFLRSVIAFTLIFPIILPTFRTTYKTHRYHLSLFRSSFSVFAIAFWVYGFSHIPLATATTITFITPIITLILAVIILKEKVSKSRVFVMLIGFIGVIVTLRPVFGEGNFYYLLIFIATCLWSIANLFRKISTKNNIKVVICYYSIWVLILTFFISLPFWHLFSLKSLPLLFVSGVLSAILNVMAFNSYKYNDISLIQSFDFVRLIIASFADIFLFGLNPTIYIFIGSLIIVFSSIWLVIRESKKLKNITTASFISN